MALRFFQESSILSAEHAEFEAKRGLLDQRIKAQERQIAELKQQLVSETDRANQAKLDSQQIVFEKNSQTVQLTALMYIQNAIDDKIHTDYI